MTMPSTAGANLPFDRDYPGEPGSLRSSRRDVVRVLGEHGMSDDLCDTAALVVSELASNAIEAAPGRDYTVRVGLGADGEVEIMVRNHSQAEFPGSAGSLPPPWAPRGRGLAIVEALSTDLEVDRVDGDLVVVTVRLAG